MKYKGMSRSHLFLIELIVVILFFAFASGITVQVFSKSSELDHASTALNGAVMAVQTTAETDKTVPFEAIDPAGRTTFFDQNWNASDRSKAVYTITSKVALQKQPAGVTAVYEYTAAEGAKVIYRLQAKKYYSGETVPDGSSNEVN